MQRWIFGIIFYFAPIAFAQAQAPGQATDSSGVATGAEPRPDPKAEAKSETKPKDPKEAMEVATLGTLSPFQDVAIIQKRFLPKTGRIEAFPAIGVILNQAFYMNYIFSGRFTYHLTESYGLEANLAAFTSIERAVTTDLRQKRGIVTSSIVSAKSYYGLDFRWTPLYGKMGFTNKTIIPFDMYFVGGAGLTNTSANTSPMTYHIGAGQLFAISKGMAARWDMGWYIYNSNGTYTDMHLTIGASFFFPEAKYR